MSYKTSENREVALELLGYFAMRYRGGFEDAGVCVVLEAILIDIL